MIRPPDVHQRLVAFFGGANDISEQSGIVCQGVSGGGDSTQEALAGACGVVVALRAGLLLFQGALDGVHGFFNCLRGELGQAQLAHHRQYHIPEQAQQLGTQRVRGVDIDAVFNIMYQLLHGDGTGPHVDLPLGRVQQLGQGLQAGQQGVPGPLDGILLGFVAYRHIKDSVRGGAGLFIKLRQLSGNKVCQHRGVYLALHKCIHHGTVGIRLAGGGVDEHIDSVLLAAVGVGDQAAGSAADLEIVFRFGHVLLSPFVCCAVMFGHIMLWYHLLTGWYNH